MRTFAACLAAFTSLALTGPVSAPVSAQAFTDLPSRGNAVGVIEIGPELAEKLEEYGPREIDRLKRKMEGVLMDVLMDAGRFAEIESPSVNVLLVVIEDARPSRPTFDQLVGGAEISSRSPLPGGARLTAVLNDPAGEQIRTFAYTWRSTPVDTAQHIMVWTDAEAAFTRFAYQIAAELDNQNESLTVAASR